jgi:hypothetical protein
MLGWASSTRGIIQIWLQVREESLKIEDPCCILVTCWNLLSKYGDFREKILLWCIFPPKVLGMSHHWIFGNQKKENAGLKSRYGSWKLTATN